MSGEVGKLRETAQKRANAFQNNLVAMKSELKPERLMKGLTSVVVTNLDRRISKRQPAVLPPRTAIALGIGVLALFYWLAIHAAPGKKRLKPSRSMVHRNKLNPRQPQDKEHSNGHDYSIKQS